jgi:type I site-specific restriction endonuclease
MMSWFVRQAYLKTGSGFVYPIPLSFLIDLKGSGKVNNVKYTWIELDLIKRTDDFRSESHSPMYYDFRDIVVHARLGTEGNWQKRKELCLKKIYTNLAQLIKDSEAPTNRSLATFKPSEILGVDIENDTREWKDEWLELRKQGDLFSTDKTPEALIPKLPYKFFYKFKDDSGKISRLMVEDWEIGALYWNCLRATEGLDEESALDKVKAKYEKEFLADKDLYLFLGTTKEWHMRRSKNPFVIIGVFYPKIESQMSLFP